MVELALVTLIWAFSFGLIKGNLTGLDSNFVSLCRMLVSLLVFLPLLRLKAAPSRLRWRLMLTGALQYGIMYIAYIAAFQYLKAYEVALFTIFTPIYVILMDDLLQHHFRPAFLFTAALAVAGTAVIEAQSLTTSGWLIGFLLVQISNLAFAFGQVDYRRVMAAEGQSQDAPIFAWLYLGAVLTTGIASMFTTHWTSLSLTGNQVWTLLYLGAIASGLGFYLWNRGARRVDSGALAIFNDLKVPAAVAVSLLFFGEQADIPRLLLGGAVILLALGVNEWLVRRASQPAEI